MRSAVPTLVHTWLILDFFGASRRTGQPGSTLTTTIFGQSFLALVLAALLYPDHPTVPFTAANLSLSTLLVGIGFLGDAHRPTRHRADRVLVATSPLSPLALTAARALHGGFYLALITVGMALPPAILSYWVAGRTFWVVPGYVAVAVLLSAIAAGLLAILARLAGALLGAARAPLLLGTVRALILAGGFAGFALCLPHLDGSLEALPGGRLARFWPPYWAARALQDPWSGYLALLVGTAVGLFWIGHLAQRLGIRPARRRALEGPLARLDRWIAGRGPLLGAVGFVSSMLLRSPGFRLRTLPLFGLPAAMLALALGASIDPRERLLLLGLALQFPAIYLPFLVAFLPRADQPEAAWAFAASPGTGATLAREASLISVSTHLLLPIQLLALVLLVPTLGGPAALALSAFSLGTGILVAALALRRLERMPFTEPEEALDLDLGALLGGALVLALAGVGFAHLARSPWGPVPALAVLVLGWLRLRSARRRVGSLAGGAAHG